MDAREIKKQILYDALLEYQGRRGGDGGVVRGTVGRVTDTNPEDVTQAMLKRFSRVLTQMLEDAESKI